MSDLGWLDRVRLRRFARRVGRDPEVQAWAAEQRKLVAEGFYRNDSLGSQEAAMSDTPDVLDARWLPADLLWVAPHLRRLSALGYVVVKAPGLSHGDELEQVEIDPITGEIGTQAAWVRRSVPENGDTQ